MSENFRKESCRRCKAEITIYENARKEEDSDVCISCNYLFCMNCLVLPAEDDLFDKLCIPCVTCSQCNTIANYDRWSKCRRCGKTFCLDCGADPDDPDIICDECYEFDNEI